MTRPRAKSPWRRGCAVALCIGLFATTGCRRDEPGGEGELGPAAAGEHRKGPHGGRWLADGDFALELAIHERGVAPEYRAWVFADGDARDPAGVALELRLRRIGGLVDRVAFAPRGDHLLGDATVREPHSFDVEVVAREGGREHRFAFASYEGRVELGPEQVAAAGIGIEEAGPGVVHEHVVLGGRIAANEDALARIMPRFPGVVRSVHKRLGDPVAAGDLLAVIESNESLHPYDLRARLAGTVIAKRISPGEFVSSDRELFAIADLSTVWADLDVPRADFGRLRIGQRALVDAGDGTPPVETTIAYLSPIGSASTQTLLARAVLPNPDRTWRPGLFVTAEVETSSEEAAVTVAAVAVQRMYDRDVVFLVDGETFEAQPITRGRSDAQRVEVVEGLAAGQRYVASGSFVVKAEIGKSGASHDH